MERGDNGEGIDNCSFEFNAFPDREFKIFKNKDLNLYLTKWYMNNLKLQCFSFNGKYNPNGKKKFVSDFFRSRAFRCDADIDEQDFDTLSSIDIEEVPCTIQSLDFFDRILQNEDIVRKNGHIMQCYEEIEDGIQVPDELRKLLINPDSNYYELFNEDERKEFIFRIFKHFVIGGEYCQYENIIYHYLGMTKTLYKDIICVRKNMLKIKIVSDVFKVNCMSKRSPVYPSKRLHMQDFAYFVVNPITSKLVIFSYKWI